MLNNYLKKRLAFKKIWVSYIYYLGNISCGGSSRRLLS